MVLVVRYRLRTGIHNIHKELRDVSACEAIPQMYMEMSGRHRIVYCIQVGMPDFQVDVANSNFNVFQSNILEELISDFDQSCYWQHQPGSLAYQLECNRQFCVFLTFPCTFEELLHKRLHLWILYVYCGCQFLIYTWLQVPFSGTRILILLL